jgi:hypothetical protein
MLLGAAARRRRKCSERPQHAQTQHRRSQGFLRDILEVALSYLQDDDSMVDRLGYAMTGIVSQLFDILNSDELYTDPNE